ncbi:sulfite exporter TauE/SafE family protein [Desulfotalea psychrophila]|nr:sulfite exporter TauE/SafE family protein [Desulfotalea psychrophila]
MASLVVFFAWMLAGFVNNIAGFGAAMVAMPIIAIWSAVVGESISVAVPSCTLIVLALNVQLAWSHRSYIQWARLKYLVIGGIFGTAVGIKVLPLLSETVLQLSMGIFLILYGGLGLIRREKKQVAISSVWGLLAGILSTILGLAFGFNGPPLAVYVALTRWPQEAVKGILSAAFILSCLIILVGQILTGLQTLTTFLTFLLALPGVLCGGFVGIRVSKRLGERSYRTIIFVGLIFMGLSLLVAAF